MNKSIQKILSIIPDSIRDPFFILQKDGKIEFANNRGSTFLNLTEAPGSIMDYLEPESGKKFTKLLDEAIEKNELLESDSFEIKFISGEKANVKIIFNIYEQGSGLLVFCTIIPQKFNVSLAEKNRISYTADTVQSIIKDKNLFEAVERVKSLYPITYIGREIVHKLTDNLDEIFWLTDATGKLIIVNKFFAQTMGFNVLQMEGKNAEDFLPGYLKDFNSAIYKFMEDTINCTLTEGVYFKEVEVLKDKQIVRIPLLDEEENICGLIGFSQETESVTRENIKDENLDDYIKILDYFPKPVAFITDKGIFKHSSKDFSKLLQLKPEELHGLKFADILPKSLADSIQRFVLSSDKLRILPVSKHLEIAKDGEPEYTVYITKLFNGDEKPEGISILFEKIEYVENLQHLIKGRGRMFEFLVQNNPEPIFVYDKENLQFLEVNQAALDLYGYSRDEFLQMDLTDLYNPDDIQTLLGSSKDTGNEGKFSGPTRHKRKDGSSLYVELSKISFKFNERDAFFNIIKDVSRRLELLKKNQLFKAAFDNTTNMIFITDSDGIISFANNNAINVLGLKKSELENSSMASLVDEDDRLTINSTIFQTHLTDSVELNIGLKCADGRILNTEISATPILDFENNIEAFVINGKTIVSAVGDDTSGEGDKEVIVDKQDVQSSPETSQLETAFLSGVFHEILTPMNVILGFAQELTEGIENLSPDQKEAVEIINQNRGKLLSTMNAIIEFFDIQKNKDEWEIAELTITDVVDEISNDIFEITGSKDINFAYGKISSSLQFETDKRKFDCLVNNLIRLICRLVGDEKVYFSAYQVDDNKFMIMISDNYSSTSDGLTETLNKLFVDGKDPKELGIPKLGVQIIKSMTGLLGVEYTSSADESGNHAVGFLFPIRFNPLNEQREVLPDEKISDETYHDLTQPQSDELKTKEFQSDQTAEHVEEDFSFEPTEDVDEVFNETPLSADDLTEQEIQQEVEPEEMEEPIDQEPESASETPEILSPSENKFDAIDFVSDVESTQLPSEIEETEIVDEQTDLTDDLDKPLAPESEPEQDEPVEEINLINRQGFTMEDSGENHITSSEDKLELKGLTCLYIEDQVDSQILFKVQMKGLKDIKYAVSFEDSLPLLKSETFDFIVMDINLQGEYNGLDALKIIHKMPKYEETPIIAVTAYVLPGDKEKFIATGFDDFISKPIFREKMVSSLEKIFLQKA